MEIGSFIELQLNSGKEYYQSGKYELARLNNARAAIWHALRVLNYNVIWLPYYQCKSVRDFLNKKKVSIKYYHIDSSFTPTDLYQGNNEAVLLVNYFGIMSDNRMSELAYLHKNVIIDNSQAFFAKPIKNCLNVYSARKFIGVPDGAYVVGENASVYIDEYEQGYSSDTALFLLHRIEYGCEGKAYTSRTQNENRIATEDCKKMSKLARYILDGTDYDFIDKKRKENFYIAHNLFCSINKLDPMLYYDESCVPMVYPLLIEDDKLLGKLLKAKHFQGHWWKWVLENPAANDFEKWLSRYMIPITIDQRYGKKELLYLSEIIGADYE